MEQVWESEDLCVLKGVPFRYRNSDYGSLRTTADQVVILKPRTFFEQYRQLPLSPVKRILEVGVFEGGSALLLADIFPDAKIVGIDIRPADPSVRWHIANMGYGDRIKLYSGVSQDDKAQVEAILEKEFAGEPIDLVIDDASHMYGFTTRCFDIVFPRLRVGGCYVIEDWGWANWPGYKAPDFFFEDRQPLATMILELAMATASNYGAIRELTVTFGMARLVKGGELPPFAEMVNVNAPDRWIGFQPRPPR